MKKQRLNRLLLLIAIAGALCSHPTPAKAEAKAESTITPTAEAKAPSTIATPTVEIKTTPTTTPTATATTTAAITTTVAATKAKTKTEPEIRGLATWYGPEFSGSRTANGEMFNPHGLTAAHHSLPFGTQVRVTNVKNGRSVVVRINDRLGDPGIVIDLSMGAARSIGLLETSPITMTVLGR